MEKAVPEPGKVDQRTSEDIGEEQDIGGDDPPRRVFPGPRFETERQQEADDEPPRMAGGDGLEPGKVEEERVFPGIVHPCFWNLIRHLRCSASGEESAGQRADAAVHRTKLPLVRRENTRPFQVSQEYRDRCRDVGRVRTRKKWRPKRKPGALERPVGDTEVKDGCQMLISLLL